MRRLISILLLVTMIFSCGIVAMADDAIVSEQPAVGVEEIDFLSRLGIMDADADPEETITRAEMAKLVMMCLGQGTELAPASTQFADVSESNKYSGYIQLAGSAGIMVGDGNGNFNPNGNVTYNQVVKLLTHAIGHEAFAQAAGGYPGGYLVTALNNEMLVGTTPSGEQAVSRGVAAILIKNALDIDIYERMSYGDSYEYASKAGVTTLTKFFDVYEMQGVITSNGFASISGASSIKDDEIMLDGATILKTGESGAEDYLGYNVQLYVKVDKNARYNTIVAAYPQYNTVTVVDGEDVMNRTSDTLLVYLDAEDEEEELKIDINADMIYNGSQKFWSAEDLKGIFGDITAIDNDDDGDADVLVVYNYRNVIVSSTKVADNIVRTKDETEDEWKEIEIDPENEDIRTTFVYADGDEAYVEDLEEGNVISIALSDDKTVMKAILCDETEEGTIEAFDDDTITVGGKEYKYDVTKVATPSADNFGREAVFYLDFAGRIAAIEFEGATAGMEYGYLKTAAISGTGFSRKTEVEILVEDGLTVFELAKKVKLNGTSMDNEAVLADTTITSGGNAIEQLIMYKLDDEGKIKAIKTAQDGTQMTKEERLEEFTLDNIMTSDNGYIMYLRDQKIFCGGYMLSNDTKCFVVPTAAEMATAEDEDYYVLPVKEVANWAYMYLENVTFYDINEDYEAEAVILDYRDNSFDRGNQEAGTNGLVTGMYKALNEDDEEITRITLLNNTGAEIEIDVPADIKVATTASTLTNLETEEDANIENGTLKPEIEVSALKVGDYVTYGYDRSGEINRLNLLFRAGNAPEDNIELDKSTLQPIEGYPDLYGREFLVYGNVDKVVANAIIITPISAERILPVTSKTVYFKYDTEDEKISFITKADVADGDLIFFDYETNVIICIE